MNIQTIMSDKLCWIGSTCKPLMVYVMQMAEMKSIAPLQIWHSKVHRQWFSEAGNCYLSRKMRIHHNTTATSHFTAPKILFLRIKMCQVGAKMFRIEREYGYRCDYYHNVLSGTMIHRLLCFL